MDKNKIPPPINNKIVAEANWRSTNGHGGVDNITRDNFIQAAEFGYLLSIDKGEQAESDAVEFLLWMTGDMFINPNDENAKEQAQIHYNNFKNKKP